MKRLAALAVRRRRGAQRAARKQFGAARPRRLRLRGPRRARSAPRRAARLRRARRRAGDRARHGAARRARRRVRAHGCGDAPQPRDHRDDARRAGADALLAARRCATGMGSRLLRHWLHHPLRDRAARGARHDAIGALPRCSACAAASHAASAPRWPTSSASPRASRCAARARATSPGCATRSRLLPRARTRRCRDAQPASLDAAAARPRDAAGRCIDAARAHARGRARGARARRRRDRATATTPSSTSCARSRTNCGAFLLELEARERERTGIANLRVEYNRVHGFYIEVTHAHADKVPDDYRRRQTLKNAERYITPELKAFEDKALSAQERALAREKLLYDELLDELAPHLPTCRRSPPRSPSSTCLPRSPSGAERSTTRAAVRRRAGIEIEAGRHPVVEGAGRELHRQRLRASRRRASCCSSPARTWAASRPTCGRSR